MADAAMFQVSRCENASNDDASNESSIEHLTARIHELTVQNERLRRKNMSDPSIILEIILKALHEHYSTVNVGAKSILNRFYVSDDRCKWHILTGCESELEDLMYGHIAKCKVKFIDEMCEVKLHPILVSQGLPMITLKYKNKLHIVLHRAPSSTHMHLFKFQPLIYGMACNPSVCEKLKKNLKDTNTLHVNNSVLKSLCCVWLGRDEQTTTCDATLFVSKSSLVDFLELVTQNESYRCFFLLSGQDTFFAYIQVNDEDNHPIFMLPVGSFCLHD